MEAIIQNLIKALGWSIVHSLWQGAILYIILFGLFALMPKASPRIKHNIAFGTLLLTLAAFIFTVVSTFSLPVSHTNPGVKFNEQDYVLLLKEFQKGQFATENIFPFIVIIYLLGILFQTAFLVNGYIRLKKIRNYNIQPVPAEWSMLFQKALQKLNISKSIGFYLSTRVSVPLAIGYFKPIVLFPVALINHLDTEQVEAILLHELAHIRRNDYLINLIKVSIETMLFFNPFVWLTSRFMHIEREHACDDLVVRSTKTPLAYAKALLHIETLRVEQAPAMSMAATGNTHYLLKRIKRITNMERNYPNVKQQLFAIALTLFTFITVAWIAPDRNKNDLTKNKETTTETLTEINHETEIREVLTLREDSDTTSVASTETPIVRTTTVIHHSDNRSDSLKATCNDTELKANISKIEANAKKIEHYHNSPEFKAKIAKIEANAKEVEKYFGSPEFKAKISKIEANAKDIEKYFNSPEFQGKIAKIELEAKKIEKYVESSEFKQKIAKIESSAKDIEKYVESPEFKAKIAKIESSAKNIAAYYESPEFKAKINKITEAYEAPEYQEIHKKFEQELETLHQSEEN
ncbi:M56 family metallopeptidase [Sphingobacterium pedocola]|uniref:Peptidase M56 domain-containing protein n=1 Tax=Sphingobacterium pedocola TaxID=2082722 RepID=A0ABR9T8G0_9SPHI|nr:M56 family metallopeptidase [Sphingobacterium pedocola]MBE8721384.1 hypothetical protein [Sphingobacterium pedocola]